MEKKKKKIFLLLTQGVSLGYQIPFVKGKVPILHMQAQALCSLS